MQNSKKYRIAKMQNNKNYRIAKNAEQDNGGRNEYRKIKEQEAFYAEIK